MHRNSFTYKGFGRIYVDKAENIPVVLEAIKAIDEYEFEGYLPKDLIAPFSEYPKLVYTGKFDIDMHLLTARCWQRGVCVWVLDNGLNEYLN